MTVVFDPNVLLSWYQAKASLASAAAAGDSGGRATAATAAQVPTAPWNRPGRIPKDGALVTAALTGAAFVNENAAKVDVPTANADYKRLFALNQALLTLQALANAAKDTTTSQFELPAIRQAFARGLGEISSYVANTKFDEFRLTPGIATSTETSSAAVPQASDTYTTPVLATGSSTDPVAAFQGAVQFNLDVKKVGGSVVTVNFDLAELGSTTRSVSAVAAYLNSKLSAAGVGARVTLIPSQTKPETITVNGQPVTIAPSQTQWAFQFSGLLNETLTFSAPTTNPGIYIGQAAGNPNPDGVAATNDSDQQQELLKLEGGSGADAASRPSEATYTAGEVFSEKLPDGVSAVRATATGADGSVYLLADATGTVNGQPIKGAQDAVLLKYDSAGQLIYTRTLGAGGSASGFSLAVSADGKVAVAGSVTGQLDNGDSGADPTLSDSFVTLYDAQGQELWTQRQGADGTDRAKAVAFDASGAVYVAGETTGSIGGGTPLGGQDAYLRAYDTSGHVLATRQFGSTGDDKVTGLVVDGSTIYVAGQDGANGLVRSFDVGTPGAIAAIASRDLGSLGGGSIGAIGLDGAGNLLLGGGAGADLNVANTTIARGGLQDGFGARISADLTSTAADAIAYYGGSGSDRIAGATIAGGQVWITGASTTDLPGAPSPIGKQDGFVAALDVGAGAVTYAHRFTARDSIDAPETIAVDAAGGSALDRLGLPRGTLASDGSQLVTSATAARAGDQFQIKVGNFSPTTVTIAADDTLDTLIQKIERAGLFELKASKIFSGSGYELQLKPQSDRVTFQLLAGPPGRNALAALGLTAGLVRNTVIDKTRGVIPADGGTQTYGLRLSANLDLNSSADISAALDAITNAITTVRAIYADLKQAATPKNPLANLAGGQVPAYLQNRIADYQAALDRLSGGGSSLASLFG